MWQGCGRSVLTLLLLRVVGVSSGEGVAGVSSGEGVVGVSSGEGVAGV